MKDSLNGQAYPLLFHKLHISVLCLRSVGRLISLRNVLQCNFFCSPFLWLAEVAGLSLSLSASWSQVENPDSCSGGIGSVCLGLQDVWPGFLLGWLKLLNPKLLLVLNSVFVSSITTGVV